MIHFPKIKEDEYLLWKDLAKVIWDSTYSTILSKEQIDYMLDLFYNKELFLKILGNSKHTLCWIIKDEIKVGFYHTELVETDTLKIQKLYLDNRYQKLNLGSLTIAHIEDFARENKPKYLTLNVNKYNSACQFYLKKGFTIEKSEILDIGKGFVMDDYILIKEIF